MITTGKKKDTVVCWREIGIFFVVAGNFHYDREKKRYITTGKKKRYSRLSVGYTVLAITTVKKNLSGEKKKIQLSVKKKVPSVQFVLVQLELKLIQIR